MGNWRWSFLPYGVALFTAVFVWRGLPHRPTPPPQSLRRQVGDAVAVLRQPAVLGSVTYGFVLFILIFGLFLTVLPILLEDRFGLSAGARGLVLAVPATGSTIAALSLGRLRARFGRRRLLLAASVLFCIGFAVIGWASLLGLVFVGAVLYGLGEGMSIPTVQDVVAGQAPEESRGAVVAVWVGAARAGQTVGPLLAAACLAAVGPSATYLLGAGVALAMLVAQLVIRIDRIEARTERGEAVTSGP